MTTNITPEDREHWDKKMKAHARRLKRQERAPQIRKAAIITLSLILAAACLFLNIRDRATFQPATVLQDSIEQVLDDTLQMDQGRLPDLYDTIDRPEGSVLLRVKRRDSL